MLLVAILLAGMGCTRFDDRDLYADVKASSPGGDPKHEAALRLEAGDPPREVTPPPASAGALIAPGSLLDVRVEWIDRATQERLGAVERRLLWPASPTIEELGRSADRGRSEHCLECDAQRRRRNAERVWHAGHLSLPVEYVQRLRAGATYDLGDFPLNLSGLNDDLTQRAPTVVRVVNGVRNSGIATAHLTIVSACRADVREMAYTRIAFVGDSVALPRLLTDRWVELRGCRDR